MNACLAGHAPQIRSDGSPERDYLHVSDAAAAYLAIEQAVKDGPGRGEALNAGTGAPKQLEASLAKCFANEMVKKVTDLAIQLHGGYGYAEEYEIERMHRDAVGWAIAGGTPTIQRTRIVSEFLGRRFDQRG